MASNKNVQNFTLEGLPGDSKVTTNYSTDVIAISEDKVKLILIDHKKALSSGRGWIGAASLVLTFLTALVGTDFKNYIFTKEAWNMLFVIGLIVSFGWFIKGLCDVVRYRKKSSLEHFIERMRKEAE